MATEMLHVRVDETLKAKATESLAKVGLTLSDAVRILLTRVVDEGGLPAGLTTDAEAYDKWFRAKVQEALDSAKPRHSIEEAKAKTQSVLAEMARAKSVNH